MSKPKQDRMITYLKDFRIKKWFGIEIHKDNQLRQIACEIQLIVLPMLKSTYNAQIEQRRLKAKNTKKAKKLLK